MDIEKAVEEALEHGESPPPNESNTCDWVILPILYAVGYGKREVVSHGADSAGKFPDYTLLPGEPQHTFYVEAKAWKVDLEDGHAIQALNYANQNGRRWVVLTNGRHWCLYDNDIRGVASGKMVAEMHLEDREQAVRFLDAIGKASVCSGMLPRFVEEEVERRRRTQEEEQREQQVQARRARLTAVLKAELTSESSALVIAMLAHLRGREGLDSVAAKDLVAYFTGARKPEDPRTGDRSEEVLIIPARFAWDEYQKFSAYMCQPKRSFRRTSRLGFYVRGVIEAVVPKIIEVMESVELSEKGIAACLEVREPARVRLLELLHAVQREGDRGGRIGQRHKVMFLSPPDSPETLRLPHPVANDLVTKAGRPWPFVVGQRYVRLDRLLAGPRTTSELVDE